MADKTQGDRNEDAIQGLRRDHTALRMDYERHDGWVKRAWRDQEKFNRDTNNDIDGPRGLWSEVHELKIVTAISKTKLGAMLILSNVIGGGITIATIWIAKTLEGG